jgi:hypothetical protein
MCILFSVALLNGSEKGIRSHFPKTVFLLALTVTVCPDEKVLLTAYGWNLYSFEDSHLLGCDAMSFGECYLM